MKRIPKPVKEALGAAVTVVNPQCDFSRFVVVIGHMRSGSTALTNVLCSHPDMSGYGEAFITYDSPCALGKLVLNQIRRSGWRARARYLCDKVLHDRYDLGAVDGFFASRAVFLARAPAGAIRSIVNLAERGWIAEYSRPQDAADYYEARLTRMLELHNRFPAANRIALTHDMLTGAPDATLARVTDFIELHPPLSNAYASATSTHRSGTGDPLRSWQFSRIVDAGAATSVAAVASSELTLDHDRVAALNRLFEEFATLARSDAASAGSRAVA